MPIVTNSTKSPNDVPKAQGAGKSKVLSPPDSGGDSLKPALKSNGMNIKIIAICVAVVVAVALFAVIKTTMSKKDSAEVAAPVTDVVQGSPSDTADQSVAPGTTQAAIEEEDSDGMSKPWLASPDTAAEQDAQAEAAAPVQNKDGVAGIKDISGDTVKKNTAPVVPEKFVKDLKGKPVAENYDIANIKTVIDFISYKKNRAVTGEGVELYWLDATYKGKPAKVQVPLSIFKELDEVGVTVVDVEIAEVYDGNNNYQEIATSFSVNPSYKEVLEQNKN